MDYRLNVSLVLKLFGVYIIQIIKKNAKYIQIGIEIIKKIIKKIINVGEKIVQILLNLGFICSPV